MSCESPLYALKLGVINDETGKEKIKILPRVVGFGLEYYQKKYGSENVLLIPCGSCKSCLEDRAKVWSCRCVLEASLYEKNTFITLTYSDSCLPKYGLCKKDVTKFLHRLRYYYPSVRYFYCGEYGEHTKRPHYHLIIFNYWPDDAKFVTKARFGGNFFRSKFLQDLWPYGFVSIGEVTFASCSYVARYCVKKINVDNSTGEFINMSRRPGIGEGYFKQHYKDIYDCDILFGNFGKSKKISPFRYYDKLFARIDENKLEEVKNTRINNSNLLVAASLISHGFEYVEQVQKYDAEVKNCRVENLKREEI